MSDKPVLWEFRYRSPLAPTKGVDTVLIETNSTDPKRAEEVARDWLNTERAHPASKFVYIRPAVVHTEDTMKRRLAQAPSPVNGKTEEPRATQPSGTAQAEGGRQRVGA